MRDLREAEHALNEGIAETTRALRVLSGINPYPGAAPFPDEWVRDAFHASHKLSLAAGQCKRFAEAFQAANKKARAEQT